MYVSHLKVDLYACLTPLLDLVCGSCVVHVYVSHLEVHL